GWDSYKKLQRDLALWMKQDQNPDARFSTMVDLYSLSKTLGQPRQLAQVPRLECLDLLLVAERHRDLVLSTEQTVAPEGIDGEGVARPVRPREDLGLEVDGHRGARPLVQIGAQRRGQLSRHDDRQRAVLEAVLVEDVAEARADEAPEPGGHERPYRSLARGAA